MGKKGIGSVTKSAYPDNAHWTEVLSEVARCAAAWEGEARLLGNVRAIDICRAVQEMRMSIPNRTTKPRLREDGQFLAWLSCEEPEKDAAFYDYCNSPWEAAKEHARMHWEAGHHPGCFEVIVEDWKGLRHIIVVNVRMVPQFDASAKKEIP